MHSRKWYGCFCRQATNQKIHGITSSVSHATFHLVNQAQFDICMECFMDHEWIESDKTKQKKKKVKIINCLCVCECECYEWFEWDLARIIKVIKNFIVFEGCLNWRTFLFSFQLRIINGNEFRSPINGKHVPEHQSETKHVLDVHNNT